ncbi:hypothetical protein TBLA_0J01010 [Henningerozyma blattae CBS 6284]|uniref:Zinc/iron permease n=1 Tax=Henningerozyma blattae (strain ATCC 34711 / CBS 6284 / DSM 70876 / NBRC 10599 / NRRL Y-10934 / UCD 77-7) TaxID=1071380 RepID=I2H9P7_HENB6|nr:hypothetical protein TBLA_0J01010 [Tetrapisispora blattae CBS 6284]CCH63099.1 hypothetical protein TBLA_0J01010 [Tetrapisispora blattae CBS 6284]
MFDNSVMPRWLIFSLFSSLSCICGGCLVPILFYLTPKNSHNNINTKLVNYGLSLSAGSMLTTSLYKLIPRDVDNNLIIFEGLLIGIGTGLFLNSVIHSFASESLIHCADEGAVMIKNTDASDLINDIPLSGHDHPHNLLNGTDTIEQAPTGTNPSAVTNENTPLLTTNSNEPKYSLVNLLDLKNKKSSGRLVQVDNTSNNLSNTCSSNPITSTTCNSATTNPNTNHDLPCLENDIGYDLENISIYRNNFMANGLKPKLASSDSNKALLSHHHKKHHHNQSHNRNNQDNKNDSGKNSSSVTHESEVENSTSNDNSILDDAQYNTFDSNTKKNTKINSANNVTVDGENDTCDSDDIESQHHLHQIETPFSKLISIGFQTCLVMTLHKFPEGFIIFYTNRDGGNNVSSLASEEESLGFSIFISLAIHNFVEGFAMTLPFYTAFEYKYLAVLITAILGGGSQPMGAAIGYFLFRGKGGESSDNSKMMDLLLSITGGFLLLIALQMFQTGIGFSDGHHHHMHVKEAEEDLHDDHDHGVEDDIDDHSLATTCIKWCCFGILLIFASNIFI